MDHEKVPFCKLPENPEEHIARLRMRGLVIEDEQRIARYLKFIGYYRLGGYCRAFQEPGDLEHTFKKNITFQNILDLYIFDRKLRLHMMDALERIEVAVRSVINDHMSLKYGSQWYVDSRHFQREGKFNHSDFMSMVKKETGYNSNSTGPVFCRHYYETYCDPLLPPSWMVAEVLPLGAWSRIYSALTEPKDRKAISNTFKVRYELFGSWLYALSYLRNRCAHHSLLWNLRFVVTPKMTHEFRVVVENDRFFAHTVVVQQFLKAITTNATWLTTLIENHLNTCPIQPYEKEMGFIKGWEKLPFMAP